MAAIQSKNRAELRQSIGYQLGACTVGTATADGDLTTFKDTVNLFGGDDEYNGSWVVVTDATDNTVNIRRITDYASSTSTITVSPALTFNVATGDAYEIYDNDLPPARIHDFINRAISGITRKGAPQTTGSAPCVVPSSTVIILLAYASDKPKLIFITLPILKDSSVCLFSKLKVATRDEFTLCLKSKEVMPDTSIPSIVTLMLYNSLTY